MSIENIWAPWRLDYVKEESEKKDTPTSNGFAINREKTQQNGFAKKKCFLCDYLQQDAANDQENYLLLRGEHAMVVFNRYPYNNGHLLITPQEHLADLMTFR